MKSFLRRIFRRENRMHKRPLVTALTVFVTFVLASTLLFAMLGLIRKSSDYPTVKVQNDTSGVTASGLGVNLSYIPSTNLLWDPSFEDQYVEDVFRVSEAAGNTVYLHSDAAKSDLSEMFSYQGGTLRIMSYDEEGRMNQLLSAGILDYQMNQLGIWKVVDTGKIVNPDAQKVFADEGYTLVIDRSGKILADVTSAEPVTVELEEEEDPVVDVALGYSCDYAVTSKGTFFISSNGRAWSTVMHDPAEEKQLNAVTSVGKIGIACGQDGYVLVCDNEHVITPNVGTGFDFHTAVSDGEHAILAGDKGRVYTTSNGMVFRMLTDEEIAASNTDSWVISGCSGEEFVLVSNKGELAIGRYETESDRFVFERYTAALPENLAPKQVALFPGGDIWLLTESGYIYAFSREKENWQQVFVQKDNLVEAMCASSSGSILLSRGGKLYSSTVYTKVTIDQSIGEVEVQNGDMCLLSATVPSVKSEGKSAWEVFGQSSSAQVVSGGAVMSGNSALRVSSLNSDPEEAHFVSQVISRDEVGPMQEKVFYHIRVSMKQSGMDNTQALVWISGLPEPIGTTFSDISGNWKEYSYTFVWPENKSEPGENEIRLNIGFYGKGDLYVDAVSLEREAYSEQQIKPQFVRAISDTSAGFVRLENLQLGRLGMDISSNLPVIGNELLYEDPELGCIGSGVISLETSLRLVKSVNANPWLAIDSAFSKEEMDALLGYICGGITDDFGKIRVDNGTAVPWQKQFEKIVLEITDENGLFETDLQRKAYVDYLILLVTNSAYYAEIKDSICFVDGMKYDSGKVLSKADYHSSSISISNAGEDQSETPERESLDSIVDMAYSNYVDVIPRNPSYALDTNGEWIRSLSFSLVSNRVSENQILQDEVPMNAAELVKFLLYDLGGHTSFVTVDIDVSRLSVDADEEYFFACDDDTLQNRKVKSENTIILMRTLGVLSKYAQGKRSEVAWTVPLSHRSGDEYAVELESFAFTSGECTYLIIVNPTDEQQQFMIDTRAYSKDIEVLRYSKDCEKIALAASGGLLQMGDVRYTLQPGQFCVAIIYH